MRGANEREQAPADPHTEAERLLAEATKAHREALAVRTRARKLAARLIRRVRRRHAEEHRQLADQVARLNAIRSEFHATAAAASHRLGEAWATVEAQQRHATADWMEANRYAAALDARAAELEQREKATADRLAAVESEAAGLREEAATLDRRVQHARAALADLERRRDRARSELLHIELPVELAAGVNADDLAHRELLLEREKGAVAAVRSALELESADLNDRRRLVAEQLAHLAEARAHWQRAERQTVVEMEELARALTHRERVLDEREARVVRADGRRREDAHDLWRLRLQLEAWHARLTASELRSHTESEQLEANRPARAAAQELAALRAEVERLAASVLDIELPGSPEETELTRAAEEPHAAPREPLQLGDARAA